MAIPAYKVIQRDILNQIAEGKLRPGEQIPTEAALMKQYNVSRITVQRAINDLKQQGIVLRRPRAGTFVRISDVALPKRSMEPTVHRPAPERISIGVVAPFDMTQPTIYQYINGIMNALTPSRDHVTLHNTGGVEANDRMMLENCLKDGCTGILYYPGIGSAPPLDLLIQMAANGYPCMLMDKRQPDVKLPCVQVDNVAAARTMTEHLIRKGHRKIAFAITTYTSSVYERYTGFCEAMQQAGADMNSQLCYSVDEARRRGENMEDLIRTLLDRGVTAVFCSADQPARDMVDACRRMGVQTPDQLAIAGFDGVYPGEITSMLQPYAQIGLTATQLLLDWILTGRVDRSVTCLEAQLLLGKSTEGAEFVE